jgi:hypothetical protein
VAVKQNGFSPTWNIHGPVKSQKSDDKVNSFRCKARKYEGMRRTYLYAAMTEDAAQRSRWTFYEVVNFILKEFKKL